MSSAKASAEDASDFTRKMLLAKKVRIHSCVTTDARLEAIATRLEAIANRVEAITTRLEAIASRVEAIWVLHSMESLKRPSNSSCFGDFADLLAVPTHDDMPPGAHFQASFRRADEAGSGIVSCFASSVSKSAPTCSNRFQTHQEARR